MKRYTTGQLPNWDPCAGYETEYGNRAEKTVTGRRELREEQVAALLAAEATLTSGESLGNVSITDGGALQADPVRGKVTLHATIGQHRRNDAFRTSHSPPPPVQGDECDQDVTINCTPVRVYHDAAVRIAIERNAEIGVVRTHLLTQCSGVGSANPVIDYAIAHGKRHDRGAGSGERCDRKW
jgi:hypothetical protein